MLDIEEILLNDVVFQSEFGKSTSRRYALKKYGSTVNGLMSSMSDLDLTLLLSGSNRGHDEVLEMVRNALGAQEGRYSFDVGMPRLIKPGWILRLQDTELELDIDIMVNKHSEVLHSMLILQYSLIDVRFHKLV